MEAWIRDLQEWLRNNVDDGRPLPQARPSTGNSVHRTGPTELTSTRCVYNLVSCNERRRLLTIHTLTVTKISIAAFRDWTPNQKQPHIREHRPMTPSTRPRGTLHDQFRYQTSRFGTIHHLQNLYLSLFPTILVPHTFRRTRTTTS